MSLIAADVLPLGHDRPGTYADAVEVYLRSAGVAASSQRIYRISLTTWAWLARDEQPPLGRARRGATPPAVPFATLDEPATAGVLADAFATRARLADADTVNRELSVLKTAIGWWRARGWLATNPIVGIERRPAPPDRTRALSRAQITALLELKAPLREKTLWRMLYDTCARAEEILSLDIDDLLLADKRARIVSKGGATDWVHWQSGTAQLLPRLLKGRTRGPVFLTDRRALAHTPALDVCPVTGRARLSYRRAAELFETLTRPLAHPGITDTAELELRGGWTLHQLRHSALTHEAEDGTNTPTLLARSRHASVRSLERYARPSVDAVASHVASRDPLARRTT
ncbi:site-specific tyrosine recombinase XerC [Nonomuraea coxensis DSM 45129]|uniref:Site-specific tyrosine recombinase XerC n=1 Tax=Nonomuraea coxensis DSM 45129 TaxID=1122611 RepID=A0ABX8TTM6_9ACTN|nr:tyrosine-type recombinase/integrase [Nonomuraea coxensis]QYC38830.1 site-specific tyrosine recombinase XerC [Nonomuraea coxensis DSM 45129]